MLLVVDAPGDLDEQGQVLGPQVERVHTPPKIEALVLAERAFGVFPGMAFGFLRGRVECHKLRRLSRASTPGNRLAILVWGRWQSGRLYRDRARKRRGWSRPVCRRPRTRRPCDPVRRGRRLQDRRRRKGSGAASAARPVALASRLAGSTWWASSMTIQCGRPVPGAQFCNRRNKAGKQRGSVADGDREHVDDYAVERPLQRLEDFRETRRRLGVAHPDDRAEIRIVALGIEHADLEPNREEAFEQRCRDRRLAAAREACNERASAERMDRDQAVHRAERPPPRRCDRRPNRTPPRRAR